MQWVCQEKCSEYLKKNISPCRTKWNTTNLAQHLQQLRQEHNKLQNQYQPIIPGVQFEPCSSNLSDRVAIIQCYITTDKLLIFIITKQTNQPTILSDDLISKIEQWTRNHLKAYNNKIIGSIT